MSKQPPPAPKASTLGPYPTIIQIVGRPDTGILPRTIAPSHHPTTPASYICHNYVTSPCGLYMYLSLGVDVGYIVMAFDMEVQPLVTRNAA